MIGRRNDILPSNTLVDLRAPPRRTIQELRPQAVFKSCHNMQRLGLSFTAYTPTPTNLRSFWRIAQRDVEGRWMMSNRRIRHCPLQSPVRHSNMKPKRTMRVLRVQRVRRFRHVAGIMHTKNARSNVRIIPRCVKTDANRRAFLSRGACELEFCPPTLASNITPSWRPKHHTPACTSMRRTHSRRQARMTPAIMAIHYP